MYLKNDDNIYIRNGILNIKPTLSDDKYGIGFVRFKGGIDLGSRCENNMLIHIDNT